MTRLSIIPIGYLLDTTELLSPFGLSSGSKAFILLYISLYFRWINNFITKNNVHKF